jgi:NAD+ kinase
MKIAVIPNLKTTDGKTAYEEVCRALEAMAVTVVTAKDTSFPPRDMDEVLGACDMAIAVGGDGTIIHCAKRAAAFGRPVLGINSGRLGFTAGLELSELHELERLIHGDYDTDERMMLDVTVEGEDETVHLHALNEAVLSRGALSRMIEVRVSNHEMPLSTYLADGVIVATPTGSTAYSLSAGGPIISHNIDAIVATPICPHSFFNRSIVFQPNDIIKLKNMSKSPLNISIDGRLFSELGSGELCEIKASERRLRVLSFSESNMYSTLFKKMKILEEI